MMKDWGGGPRGPSIWIGFDSRFAAPFAVARRSVQIHNRKWLVPVFGIVLERMRVSGLYWRPTEFRPSQLEAPIMWDVISEAPMATEFSISRFLTPILAESGWALFMDCDMLVRGSLRELFDSLDLKKAVYCVKHNYAPPTGVKMDGQMQTVYARKNWTSFCFFNCDHPANRGLTVELINTVPGRDLHRFCWLEDDLIGEIPPEWNWLVGHSEASIDPMNVHFTEGGPWLEAFRNVPFSDEWRESLYDWAAR